MVAAVFTSPPSAPKKKKLRFDFPEAAPKELTLHSKEKAPFFPTYRLGCKTNLSLYKRKKTHIVSESLLLPNRRTHVGQGWE